MTPIDGDDQDLRLEVSQARPAHALGPNAVARTLAALALLLVGVVCFGSGLVRPDRPPPTALEFGTAGMQVQDDPSALFPHYAIPASAAPIPARAPTPQVALEATLAPSDEALVHVQTARRRPRPRVEAPRPAAPGPAAEPGLPGSEDEGPGPDAPLRDVDEPDEADDDEADEADDDEAPWVTDEIAPDASEPAGPPDVDFAG